ncbi:DUF3052 family protein [Marinihelvus fidelis]|uniref:DUF3052 family protein n=1 Tax=Marinihelvus fidelis TaxID=2613842 RepID=A0A5N0TCQ5_9GAMM|nr:DUF3052 family protein [Marinihelvus fidelis]KAA9132531.1 DUF3052 family protein [Marinihelvus fidelis]
MSSQGAGYSGTPLATKLGIKAGSRVKVLGAPAHFPGLLAPLPEGAVVSSRLRAPVDIFHLFTTSRARLRRLLRQGLGEIPQDGAIWVSWPKKSSGVASQVTEDVIREVALPMTLVDIKVCAVDETWSALKLVVRKSHRQ